MAIASPTSVVLSRSSQLTPRTDRTDRTDLALERALMAGWRGLLAASGLAILVALSAGPVEASPQEDRSTSASRVRSTESPPPSALPGVFGEVLDVRVINLEVVVTDKKGTPILGLVPEDFRLLVDGAEVPIEYFTEVRGGSALGGGEQGTAPPGVAPGEYVGTSFLVFIDESFGIKPDRNLILRSMQEDLAFLRPEDRMAIVAYDGAELEMLSTWTSSQERLDRVLDDALLRPTNGLKRIVDRRRFDSLAISELGDAVLFGQGDQAGEAFRRFDTELSPEERAYLRTLTDQLNRVVAAASATLRSFAKPPGRKVMILLSGGWPYVPASYLVADASRTLFLREGPFGSNIYQRLAETANLLGYTLYPVDMPGLDRLADDKFDASAATPPDNRALADASGFLREVEVHSTLRYLADGTGGRALINSRRLGALERTANDTRSYYWLGFSPQRQRDDQNHRVEIVLRNPDFVARSRTSFLDSSRQSEVSMAVESTLLFGNAAAAGSLRIEVGDSVPEGKRRMGVPIKVAIPLDQVTLIPNGDQFAAELELRIAVQDDDGQQAPIPIIPLRLAFKGSPAPGAVGSYETKLVLRRKRHDAVVALHDPASGRIFSTGFEIVPVGSSRSRGARGDS